MAKKKKPTTKIYYYLAKKPYLNGKSTYVYERMAVPIPRELQHMLISYCQDRLIIDVFHKHDKIVIILDPVKTLSHTRKPHCKS